MTAEAEHLAELVQLRRDNQRLQKINQALMERVEASHDSSAYAAFEHAAMLAERVRERTAELSALNQQLREAKSQADLANQSKSRFLAAVSHDLLQPLNAARLFNASLLEQPLPEAALKQVQAGQRALEDVEALLLTLVDMAKLEAGVLVAQPGPLQLQPWLAALSQEFAALSQQQAIRWRVRLRPAWVQTDPQLLSRILRNLLTNALRYTPVGGQVLLACRPAHWQGQAGCWLQVWDTGIGIAEGKLPQIFKEFSRVHEPGHLPRAEQGDKGLGLGLAIVERSVRLLGHPLQVRSRLGKGSCFSLWLPFTDPPQSVPAPATLPGVDLQGCGILLVDNDASIVQGMEALLGSWGCQLQSYASGLAWQRDSQQQRPSLAILDYHLDSRDNEAGLDGITLAARIRQRWPALPILILTANHSSELKQQCALLGYQLLHKPIRPMKLRMQLAAMRAGSGGD